MAALLPLLLLPVLVHLPDLLGLLSSDPLPILSQLALHPRGWLDGGLLPGLPGWIDGHAGVTVQALGRLVARDWWHGIVPWWNPYSGVGTPLAGEFQPAAFFLPFVLLLGLAKGTVLLKLALQAVGGVAMAALLRALGVVPMVALLGGVLFECNGCFAWSSDGMMLPIAFLPMMLLGIERARSGHWHVLALGMAWAVLAGFPETAFLEGLLVLAWAMLRLVQARGGRVRMAVAVGLGGSVALLLAAPQLVAFLDFLPDAYLGVHGSIIDIPVPAASWAMFLFPYINGTAFFGGQQVLWYSLGGFLGLSVALLAAVGCFGRRERALRLMLATCIALALLKLADERAATMLLDAVPLLGNTVFYRYATPVWVTAAIVLAALGLDDWCRGEPRQRRRVAAGAAVVAVLAALALLADRPELASLRAEPHGRAFATASLAWGIAVALAAGALLALAATAARRRVLIGLLMLDAVALFALPLLSGRTDTAVDDPTIAFLRDHLGLQRFVTLGPVLPNYGGYYGIASINHNMIPTASAWIDRIHTALDPAADQVTFDGMNPRAPDGAPFLLAALRARPQAFADLGVAYLLVPRGFDPVPPPARAGDPLLVRRGAAADSYAFPAPAAYFEAAPACRLTPQDRERVAASCDAPATLVRLELFLPGWTATINGADAAVSRQDGLFQAVALPAGPSEVRFAYAPPHALLGWLGLLVGALTFAWAPVRRAVMPRPARSSPPAPVRPASA